MLFCHYHFHYGLSSVTKLVHTFVTPSDSGVCLISVVQFILHSCSPLKLAIENHNFVLYFYYAVYKSGYLLQTLIYATAIYDNPEQVANSFN